MEERNKKNKRKEAIKKYEDSRVRRTILFSKTEFEQVKEKASNLRYEARVNSYIKEAALTGISKPIKTNKYQKSNQEIAMLRVELRKLGVNINQLAQQMNYLIKLGNGDQFVSSLNNLKDTTDRINFNLIMFSNK
ncbi:hypothetical protein [Fulvivirga sp.]|uniref:plasmid mobilization relaxosome protein MobC n=1 Tax=Fulvivirga sp. TaxID=1931237 RepID=UPI0032EAC30A